MHPTLSWQPLVQRNKWLSVLAKHHGKQVVHRAVCFERMPQPDVAIDRITIAASVAQPGNYPSFFQFRNDALHGPLGDPDAKCHIAQAYIWLLCDADQHMRMIGKKRPSCLGASSV